MTDPHEQFNKIVSSQTGRCKIGFFCNRFHLQKKINLIHRPLHLLRKYIQNRPFISERIFMRQHSQSSPRFHFTNPSLRAVLLYSRCILSKNTIQKCFAGCDVLLRIKVHAVMFLFSAFILPHLIVEPHTRIYAFLYLFNIRNIKTAQSRDNNFQVKC